MKIVVPIVMIFILCSLCPACRQGAAPATMPSPSQTDLQPLTLDVFSNNDIPDSLMSTSCTFAENDDNFKARKYLLFIADAGSRVKK